MTSTSKIEEFVLEYICEYPKEPLFRGACEKVKGLIEEQQKIVLSYGEIGGTFIRIEGTEFEYTRSDIALKLIREQRQNFIDELSMYLIEAHNGVTREDAMMIERFLSTTGENDA